MSYTSISSGSCVTLYHTGGQFTGLSTVLYRHNSKYFKLEQHLPPASFLSRLLPHCPLESFEHLITGAQQRNILSPRYGFQSDIMSGENGCNRRLHSIQCPRKTELVGTVGWIAHAAMRHHASATATRRNQPLSLRVGRAPKTHLEHGVLQQKLEDGPQAACATVTFASRQCHLLEQPKPQRCTSGAPVSQVQLPTAVQSLP